MSLPIFNFAHAGAACEDACACVCGVPVSMWRITRQPRYPLRIGASRVAPAPLANRKIAFGCGRLAIRASASRSLSWRARYPPPLARARLRCGAASRSATAQPPLVPRAASIRECGLHGLVGIPPCALQRRIAASAVRGRRIALWPRSPSPLHLRAVGTCQFSRGASVAACTAYCEPLLRSALLMARNNDEAFRLRLSPSHFRAPHF